MYQASNISFSTQGKQIIQDLNLSITPGEFVSVVGPNGAGKSSLIKILSNENPAYKGNVSINGKDVKSYKPKELSLVRAVMAQHSTLQFAFSVREVITLGRHAHSSTKTHDNSVIDEVITLAGLQAMATRNYLTLSGGEKQRVQLARVLAQVWDEALYPRYILLDEPTSSLDIAQQQAMFSLVKSVCSRNIGVLAIVHDLNLAAQFSDHIFLMNRGQLVDSGPAVQVLTRDNIEKAFCCHVNVIYDPCSKCPLIVPDTQPRTSNKLTLTK